MEIIRPPMSLRAEQQSSVTSGGYGVCSFGEVILFPRARAVEASLSKRQLAEILGYSTRWVELRVKEGMPAHWAGSERRFLLSEVLPWLENHGYRGSDDGGL